LPGIGVVRHSAWQNSIGWRGYWPDEAKPSA
jgi:hypothetical protein